jgi:hypothetical protein
LGVFAECVPEPCVTASPRLLQLSQPQLAGLLAEKADLRAGERKWKERWKALCWKALPRDGGQTLDASLRPAAQPERASGRRRLLTCAGLQASVEQAAADISSILASEKKKKTKKVDANKMAALALIFNPVRCACRSPAASRRFFSPSSPCIGPDAGGHGVALGGKWKLGPNRPARRQGHPRCSP